MKKKIAIIASVLIILLGAGGVFWYLSQPKENPRQRQERVAWQEDMKAKNPQLYDRITTAIKEGEEKAKQDPKDVDNLLDLAANYQNLKEYAKAEQAYRKVLAQDQNVPMAWKNLGRLYRDRQEYDNAKETYLKAIEVLPMDEETYLTLAGMYAAGQAGNVDDARWILGQGILKTNSQELKDAQERLNSEGRL